MIRKSNQIVQKKFNTNFSKSQFLFPFICSSQSALKKLQYDEHKLGNNQPAVKVWQYIKKEFIYSFCGIFSFISTLFLTTACSDDNVNQILFRRLSWWYKFFMLFRVSKIKRMKMCWFLFLMKVFFRAIEVKKFEGLSVLIQATSVLNW